MKNWKLTGVGLAMLLLFGGCSLWSAPANTKPIGEIIDQAKKDLAADWKKSLTADLRRSEENLKESLTSASGEGSGELNFVLDLGGQGKISFQQKEVFSLDGSAGEKLNSASTIEDVIKSFSAAAQEEIILKISDMAGQQDQEAKVVFNAYYDAGVLKLKVNEIKLPESLPGLPPTEQLQAALAPYQGKWFKVDLNTLQKNQALVAALMKKSIYQLRGEKLEQLIALYIEDVLLKNEWFAIDQDSKTKTKKGEEYALTMTKDLALNLVTQHFDFLTENMALVDEVFDLRGVNNPFFAYLSPEKTPTDLTVLQEELAQQKAAVLQELAGAPFPEWKVYLTAAGDKVVSLALRGDFPSEEGNKGDYDLAIDFQDGEHSFKNYVLLGNLNLGSKDDKGYAKGDLKAVVKNDQTEMNLNFELKAPDENTEDTKDFVTFDFALNLAIDDLKQAVKELKIKTDLAAKDLLPGLDGFKGDFLYTGGEKKKLDLQLSGVPKEKLSLAVEGDFTKTEGRGDLDLQADWQGAIKFGAKGDLKYEFKPGAITVKAPEGSEKSEDLSPLLEDFVGGFMAGFIAQESPAEDLKPVEFRTINSEEWTSLDGTSLSPEAQAGLLKAAAEDIAETEKAKSGKAPVEYKY